MLPQSRSLGINLKEIKLCNAFSEFLDACKVALRQHQLLKGPHKQNVYFPVIMTRFHSAHTEPPFKTLPV